MHRAFVRRTVLTVSSLATSSLGGTASTEGESDSIFGLLSLAGGEGGSSSASPPDASPVSHTRPAGPPPRRSRSSTMNPTDRDLVDRARSGNAEAFGQLVRRHQQRIHRLAVHMLRDRAEAEDVTQE
ncbi:MAG TPA: sigma factor, partial [Labilithrix sp.]|nr:sigma factor [Labilithrix sp.]